MALGALAACAVAPRPDVDTGARSAFGAADDYPGAGAILAGFDAGAVDAAWRAGDEVLFGLRLERDGSHRNWLLHVRLIEPQAFVPGRAAEPVPAAAWNLRVNGVEQTFRSGCCRVLATVYDADGNVLGRTEPVLPRDFLATGFARACERIDAARGRRGHGRSVDLLADDDDPFAAATVSAMALLAVVQEDPVLAPLLWEVVDKPNLWSVVRRLGAHVLVQPMFKDARRAPSPVPAAGPRVHRVPVSLSVNEVAALETELLVRPAVPPFGLCGGIVAAMAWHPRHRDRMFTMVLLAARRGR
ncbi:MAG: hypothetical protein JNK15_22095 [Planctomycetes bacterium]|nr:hypothetical protein [Planctomycetota bacterium]